MSAIYPTKPIADIKLGQRHRKDLGDIEALAASIKEVGLLHPVVINPYDVLIAGARRIAAYRQLGWTEVPVTVVDLDQIVRGEFAENAHRKDFLPCEIDAIRRALEPEEKAAAKGRMSEGGKKVAKVSHPSRAVDKIADFAGVSGRTVEKIAAVVDAAQKYPRKFGHLPEQMDKTGKVDKAYREVRRPQQDALGHPYEPPERRKSLHGFARIRQAIREEPDRLVVEQRDDPTLVPTLRKSLEEIEKQARESDRFIPERQEPAAPALTESRFENSEDEPRSPNEMSEEIRRRRERAEQLGAWHRRG